MSWSRRATKPIQLQQPTHVKFQVASPKTSTTLEPPHPYFTHSSGSSPHLAGKTHPPSTPPSTPLSPPVCVTGHSDDRIFNVSFAPDGHDVSRLWGSFASNTDVDSQQRNWISTCGQDGTCRIWCLEYNQEHKQEQIFECYTMPCSTTSECLRMSWGQGLTRELIATSGADGMILLWNACNEEIVQRLPCLVHNNNGVEHDDKPQVYACSLFGGQSTLLMGGYDNRVMIWDITTGQPVVEWKCSTMPAATTGKAATTIAPPPLLAASSAPPPPPTTTTSPTSPTSPIAPAPTAPQHNPVSDQCFVYGASLGEIQDGSPIIAVAISDGSIAMIDPRQATSKVPAYRWKAHSVGVSDVTMRGLTKHAPNSSIQKERPDPWILTSCSADRLVKVWDLRSVTKGPVRSLGGHTKPVFGVEFWDRDHVVSWSNDGSLRQWDITGKTASLVLHEDVNYNLHGCAKKGRYVATCGGANGQKHQPAYFKIHKTL